MRSVPPDSDLDLLRPLDFLAAPPVPQPSSQSELDPDSLSLLSTAALSSASSPSSSVVNRTPPPGAEVVPLAGSEAFRLGGAVNSLSESDMADSDILRIASEVDICGPRVRGDAERPCPGDPDFDLLYAPLIELCRSLGLPEARSPEDVPYTEDMARGLGPPCDTLAIDWNGATSDILLPRGEDGALFGIAKGMPVLLRLVLRTWLLSTLR